METSPVLAKFDPLMFSNKTPDAFFFTLTLVIVGPTNVPAMISLDRFDGAGFTLRSLTASGPTLSLIEGFASRKTAKLGLGSLGFGTGAATTVPLIKT